VFLATLQPAKMLDSDIDSISELPNLQFVGFPDSAQSTAKLRRYIHEQSSALNNNGRDP
jgi:hypothetical protein